MFDTLFRVRRSEILFGAIACMASIFTPKIVMGQAPLGGYLPFVGIGLTSEFENSVNGNPLFFLAQPSNQPGGTALGASGQAYYDFALLDTGAAVHIITSEAYDGFGVDLAGFDGINIQPVGGATGIIDLEINDPLGIYAAGLANAISTNGVLSVNPTAMRGQKNIATLTAPEEWNLPNILGLPMAAQHAISIRSDLPQIMDHDGRTVRTPQIDFHNLGAGGAGHGPGGGDIIRRAPLELRPNAGFVQGPFYIYDFNNILNGEPLHENPFSPTVVENGALFIEIDMAHGDESLNDTGFLFDTGADLTVLSEQTAARLGIDPILDTPDFLLEVEGSGGVIEGIPGFYIDELNIDTVGGNFTLTNVPVAILDVTNPSEPGNVVDGILGTNVFHGRNIVIDAKPSLGQGGVGPSLYISDPVTDSRAWSTSAASGDWHAAGSWSAGGAPSELWVVQVANVSGVDQEAVVSSDSTVFEVRVSGAPAARMSLRVEDGATLTSFAHITVETGGEVKVEHGGKIDALFVQLDGGVLTGDGDIHVGSGPINGQVRNASGVIAPGDGAGRLTIVGDFSNRPGGLLEIELGGAAPGAEFDQLVIDGTAFLGGTLGVSLIDIGAGQFLPQVGDVFEVVSASEGVSGEFESYVLPGVATWNVLYLADSVRLQVTSITLIAGDFDADGDVDGDDFLAWQAGFGATSGASIADGDADGDGDVDGNDFLIWQSHFGTQSGGGSWTVSAPEPGALSLFALLLLSISSLRYRRAK